MDGGGPEIRLDGKKNRKSGPARTFLDGHPVRMTGEPGSVRELLALLKISPQEALVRVDGKIKPDGFPLLGAKKIEIVRVVFGG